MSRREGDAGTVGMPGDETVGLGAARGPGAAGAGAAGEGDAFSAEAGASGHAMGAATAGSAGAADEARVTLAAVPAAAHTAVPTATGAAAHAAANAAVPAATGAAAQTAIPQSAQAASRAATQATGPAATQSVRHAETRTPPSAAGDPTAASPHLPSAPDYGRSFAAWRGGCLGPWRAYTHHPFVQGMADGTLPRAAFLRYLVQDYLFLIHFSRAWALAVVKAGTLAEMRACAATVHALVEGEMALHVRICAAEGISESELEAAEEAPENLAYTRYVLEAGYSGDFLDLLAALAPCVLGYGEIGLRLAAEAAPDTPYRDWIDTYAGDDYQATCRTVGALIDGAIAARLGATPEALPRWQGLAHRFATATRLEAAFWGLGRG